MSKLTPFRPPRSHDHGLQLYLYNCSIMSSTVARSPTPNSSLHSPDYGLQVRTIMASKCTPKLTQSRPASSQNHGLQVHLQTCTVTACKYVFKEWRRVYGNTGVTEAERVTGSIYSADPGVDRHHLISILSSHIMKIHTLSFPTFGLTLSVSDVVDPQRQVVSCLLTQFLCSSNQNRSFSSIPCECHERCGGEFMVGSLTSSSIVSPLWPPSSASLDVLSMGVSWCSSDCAPVPCAARLTVCI